MPKPQPKIYTQYWIEKDWIFHIDPSKSAKYWIVNGWIYGPIDLDDKQNYATGYWIQDNWIWGPAGHSGSEIFTGCWINNGHIFGPTAELPFVS